MDGIEFNIKNLQNIHDNAGNVNKNKPESSHIREFEKVLSKKLNLTDSSAISPQKTTLSEIDAVYPASFTNSESGDIADRIDKTVDLLEKYTSLLSNPVKTLKDIHPVLMDLNSSAKAIASDLQAKSDAESTTRESGLENIINQIMAMVHTELFKMERGDYTDKLP